MNCPREKLTYTSFGKGRHFFKGCDQEVEMLLYEGSDAKSLGFSRGFVVPAPSNRFSKEAKCDLRSTTEERIDYQTRIVDGCGQRFTYLLACHGNCVWIANVEASSRGPQ